MFAVIFEVTLKADKQAEYLQIAAELRQQLDSVPGFISIERFASLSAAGKICSLSFWESEEAIETWRKFELHRLAQQKGKHELFEDFRIRVTRVVRDYGMHERDEAPE